MVKNIRLRCEQYMLQLKPGIELSW